MDKPIEGHSASMLITLIGTGHNCADWNLVCLCAKCHLWVQRRLNGSQAG